MSQRAEFTAPTYNAIYCALGSLIHNAIRQLLEEKHLYQSADISIHLVPEYKQYEPLVKRVAFSRWSTDSSLLDVRGRPLNLGLDILAFRVPTGLKLFCETCSSREAYNPADALEVRHSAAIFEKPSNVQDFALPYQCQHCKSACEVFLLRRDKLKLTLCGRAPMEHVEVPPFIPRKVQSYFRDAIVAYQSGKTLAALFYLRTLIEQWVIIKTGITDKADVVLDTYMEQLPLFFKSHFPSMRDLYGELSGAIHMAREDSTLYARASAEIIHHFDGRRLHNID